MSRKTVNHFFDSNDTEAFDAIFSREFESDIIQGICRFTTHVKSQITPSDRDFADKYLIEAYTEYVNIRLAAYEQLMIPAIRSAMRIHWMAGKSPSRPDP